MRLGEVIAFRNDLFFDGAVQADWFYQPEKSNRVARSFVFHGDEYFGAKDEIAGKKMTDSISFFKDIAEKLSDEQHFNPFSLAIAGYGTGKSHLAVTMAQLLSGKEFMPDTFSKVINNIALIDHEAAEEIQNYCDRPNLVIVINGMRDFNLHYEVLRAAQKSLRLYGCPDEKLKKLNRAIETAFRFFERNASNSLLLFEQNASKYGWNEKGEKLVSHLRSALGEDEIAFNIIDATYEQITGNEIRWEEGVSAGAVLETLVSEYCGISGPFNKVIILFDEFGRYLEYASSATTAHSGDSGLQQIFEAAQNAEGSIQVVNFIQSDIKAYLQRVDQTSNISRYIGRYDVSDKYYLSSNLETVFANLISKTNKTGFNSTIKAWQSTNELAIKSEYEYLDKWLSLKGIWKNYSSYRKIIVEGIYPMHPMSTFMLTQLSDYLQNRSSLTLVNSFISELSGIELESCEDMPIVLPERLLSGDLYSEILSAEQEGRQLSQHCIRFDNVLRKYGDKLTDDSKKVLRANLALRILKVRTQNYEDAKHALSIASGFSAKKIVEELTWLENEYAVIGFDEYASCFDFQEDSSGAHDFRMFVKREKASKSIPVSIFEDSSIRSISGVLAPISTNFASEKNIKTNEWQFEQNLFPIGELSEAVVSSLVTEWDSATSPEKPKGMLIWLYLNKDSDENALKEAAILSQKLVNAPILLLLLNDVDNRLHNALTEYYILSSVNDLDRKKFGRHFDDAFFRAEENLKVEFETLKKQKQQITLEGVISLKDRLGIALTDVLNQIYTNAIPFNFDGFDSKQASRAKKSYCSILRLMMSGSISNNTIHSSQVEVRNRFEATLFDKGMHSWKCVNEQYQIHIPIDKSAYIVYRMLENELKQKKSLRGKDIFVTLTRPPYGLNDYIIFYMVAVLCANLNFCVRMQYLGNTYGLSKWAEMVVADNKVYLSALQQTTIILVDASAIGDKYNNIFVKAENNKDLSLVNEVFDELQNYKETEDLPNELDAKYQLCIHKLDEGRKILANANQYMEEISGNCETAIAEKNVYGALKNKLEMSTEVKMNLARIVGRNYIFPAEYNTWLEDINKKLTEFINANLIAWLNEQKCRSLEDVSRYDNHMNKIEGLLRDLGYIKIVKSVEQLHKLEIENKDKIKERKELSIYCPQFLGDTTNINDVGYERLLQLDKECKKALERIAKIADFCGPDAGKWQAQLEERNKELTDSIERIKNEISEIWSGLYELSDFNSINLMYGRIEQVCRMGIADKDKNDLIELRDLLANFLRDSHMLKDVNNSRKEFDQKYEEIYEKYSSEELDIDLLPILNDISEEIKSEMNNKEQQWCERYLTQGFEDETRTSILKWIDNTMLLPDFLSEVTITKYKQFKSNADSLLSKINIEDVIYHFEKLNNDEKKKCLDRLIKMRE